MVHATASYALVSGLAIALLTAAVTDIRRRQIDNWLNGAIALAAPAFWWSQGLGWGPVGLQVAMAAAAFAVGAGLFAIRAMGGGDVKLLTVLALWVRPTWFLHLVFLMAILGGILTVVMGSWHVMRRRKDKLAIPYGIAIAAAGLWVLAAETWPTLGTA